MQRKDFLQLMANAHEDDDDDGNAEDVNDLHSLSDDHHNTAYFNQIKGKKTKLSIDEILSQVYLRFRHFCRIIYVYIWLLSQCNIQDYE